MNDVMDSQELIIEGVSCGSCVNKIEIVLKFVFGVDYVEMNLV